MLDMVFLFPSLFLVYWVLRLFVASSSSFLVSSAHGYLAAKK